MAYICGKVISGIKECDMSFMVALFVGTCNHGRVCVHGTASFGVKIRGIVLLVRAFICGTH